MFIQSLSQEASPLVEDNVKRTTAMTKEEKTTLSQVEQFMITAQCKKDIADWVRLKFEDSPSLTAQGIQVNFPQTLYLHLALGATRAYYNDMLLGKYGPPTNPRGSKVFQEILTIVLVHFFSILFCVLLRLSFKVKNNILKEKDKWYQSTKTYIFKRFKASGIVRSLWQAFQQVQI